MCVCVCKCEGATLSWSEAISQLDRQNMSLLWFLASLACCFLWLLVDLLALIPFPPHCSHLQMERRQVDIEREGNRERVMLISWYYPPLPADRFLTVLVLLTTARHYPMGSRYCPGFRPPDLCNNTCSNECLLVETCLCHLPYLYWYSWLNRLTCFSIG